MSSAIAAQVDRYIAENAVAVFSKTYCPYCRMAKQTLSKVGAQPFVLELDEIKEGSAIQAYLAEKTGQTTVPNVFIKQQHIGGNSDIQALNQRGELAALIK